MVALHNSKMFRAKYFFFLTLIFLSSSVLFSYPIIVINEICATNYASLYDDDLENSDWIELYNNSALPVNLGGWRIFDKNDFNSAYVLPDTIIPPRARIVIYASGKNTVNRKNFVIEAGGSGINVWNSSDGFRFHYLEIEGDFDARVRVRSLRDEKEYTCAGIIARTNLTGESPYFGVFCTDNFRKAFTFLYRLQEWEWPFHNFKPYLKYPDGWIRLEKKGNKIIAYRFFQNWYWEAIDSVEHTLGDKFYLGLAFSNYDQYNMGKATFSDFIINGDTIDFNLLKGIEINTLKSGKGYISNEIHTNFKLNAKGEKIYLWSADGTLIDTLSYGTLRADISYGHFSDGIGLNYFFSRPTPNKPNVDPKLGIAPDPEFSLQAGWYDNEIELEFTNLEENYRIFYTLDGSEPNDSSAIQYRGEKIKLSRTTPVRAKGYKYYYVPSKTVTKTYFVNERRTQLPVFSLVTDSIYLWGEEKGVFYPFNLFKDMESPANFEFFDKGDYGYSQRYYTAGAMIRMHGSTTRGFPQKAFTLNTRAKFDTTEFNFPFFPENKYNIYDKLLLRASGQDWFQTLLRDGFAGTLAAKIGLDASAYRATVLYINGTYWGIQNLREKIDEEHLSIKYKIREENINLIEDSLKVLNGSPISFVNLTETISNPDISDTTKAEIIFNGIDEKNITNYVAFRVWSGIPDWPDYNQKYWSSPDYDNKWRWAVWDSDVAFGFGFPPEIDVFSKLFDTSFVFSKLFCFLLKNDSFKANFIKTFCNLLNTSLHPNNTVKLLNELANTIADEIPYHQARWNSSAVNWEYEIDRFREFLTSRNSYVYNQILFYFNLNELVKISVEMDTTKARLKINNIDLSKFPVPDSIFYPQSIPISFEIIPKPNYKFVSWGNELLPDTTHLCIIAIDTLTSLEIKPLFEEQTEPIEGIIFNEIMYKSSNDLDCGDWVELYNNSNQNIDVSNWVFKDNNDAHIFIIPQNTTLSAHSYLVLCENSAKFTASYPEVKNYIGDFGFGLGRPDMVRLYDKNGFLIDSVAYSNKIPWDEQADGTGYSLELINFSPYRNEPTNWRASFVKGGTPGEPNSTPLEAEAKQTEVFQINCSPLPFEDYLRIDYSLPVEAELKIYLHNITGELLIETSVKCSQSGYVLIPTTQLPTGVYFCTAETYLNNQKIKKTIPIIKINN